MTKLYLDDLRPGLTATSQEIIVTEAEIRAFATRFDPQPFPSRRRGGPQLDFRRLGGKRLAHGRNDNVTDRPGRDSAGQRHGGRGRRGIEVADTGPPRGPVAHRERGREARPSQTKPDRGIARIRTVTRNQAGATVQSMVSTVVVPRRAGKA